MRLLRIPRLAALLVVALPAFASAQRDTVRVPNLDLAPILLDGRLSRGEWDAAAAQPIGPGVRLLAQQARGHVFLAIATGTGGPRQVDIYLEDASGLVHQLHASAQIGERHLADTLYTGESPAWRWGNHVDWLANEAKVDATRPAGSFASRLFPADGTEFQLRRSRFPGRRWRVRIECTPFVNGAPALVFPHGATRDPASWAVLELE